MSKEIMQQALSALEAGPDVDPIFAGETADALRAALAAPQGEAVAWIEGPHGAIRANPLYRLAPPPQTLAWRIPLYTTPPAAPQGEAHELRVALHQISLASQNSMSSKEECGRIARNALHAVAPPASPSVPAGWKLVPMAPTREMLRMARTCFTASNLYRAMVAAAPEPPSGEGEK